MSDNNFAIERLESRLEQICLTFPYVGICYMTVWFIRIPYPCMKSVTICF